MTKVMSYECVDSTIRTYSYLTADSLIYPHIWAPIQYKDNILPV